MNEHLERRKKLVSEMPKNSLAIIFGSNTQIRNGDVEFPFRQNSDFLYLIGFDEPNAVAIIVREPPSSIFLAAPKNLFGL